MTIQMFIFFNNVSFSRIEELIIEALSSYTNQIKTTDSQEDIDIIVNVKLLYLPINAQKSEKTLVTSVEEDITKFEDLKNTLTSFIDATKNKLNFSSESFNKPIQFILERSYDSFNTLLNRKTVLSDLSASNVTAVVLKDPLKKCLKQANNDNYNFVLHPELKHITIHAKSPTNLLTKDPDSILINIDQDLYSKILGELAPQKETAKPTSATPPTSQAPKSRSKSKKKNNTTPSSVESSTVTVIPVEKQIIGEQDAKITKIEEVNVSSNQDIAL